MVVMLTRIIVCLIIDGAIQLFDELDDALNKYEDAGVEAIGYFIDISALPLLKPKSLALLRLMSSYRHIDKLTFEPHVKRGLLVLGQMKIRLENGTIFNTMVLSEPPGDDLAIVISRDELNYYTSHGLGAGLNRLKNVIEQLRVTLYDAISFAEENIKRYTSILTQHQELAAISPSPCLCLLTIKGEKNKVKNEIETKYVSRELDALIANQACMTLVEVVKTRDFSRIPRSLEELSKKLWAVLMFNAWMGYPIDTFIMILCCCNCWLKALEGSSLEHKLYDYTYEELKNLNIVPSEELDPLVETVELCGITVNISLCERLYDELREKLDELRGRQLS